MPHLSPAKLKKELARMDALIAQMETIVEGYDAFTALVGDGPVAEPVYDAWNAANDALDTLKYQRDQVAANPRDIPPGEMGTWLLVQQNID